MKHPVGRWNRRFLHPGGWKSPGLRIGVVGLVGLFIAGCGSAPEWGYSESVTLEGALHCCMIMTDEDMPEPTVTGWYVKLKEPMMIGRRFLDRIEVFPIYRFQMAELERFEGRSVTASGFITTEFIAERNEWIYGLKLISIEAAARPPLPSE